MKTTKPNNFTDRTRANPSPQRFSIRSINVVLFALLALSANQTLNAQQAPHGTFKNPPKVGEPITPHTGSVVCLKEIDAMSMASSGFFAPSCETITPDMNLVAESIEQRDAGENRGLVWMVRTTLNTQTAWVPIPWHDWA